MYRLLVGKVITLMKQTRIENQSLIAAKSYLHHFLRKKKFFLFKGVMHGKIVCLYFTKNCRPQNKMAMANEVVT